MAEPTDQPSPPTYISLGACNEPDDLERLRPHEFAEIAGRSATMLDFHRLRLATQHQMAELARMMADITRQLADRDDQIARALQNEGRYGT